MPLVLANRVQETGTANTTVSFTLTGAVTGFQSFAVIGNTNTTYYSAIDGAGNWEVGLGAYSTSGPTLTRTTIYASSNSGSAVTFPGSVNVFVTYPSGRSVNLNESGNVSALGTVSSGTWQGSTVGVAYGGTGVTSSSGPNSVVLRDANENITVNRINQGLQTITASGGTTTLTAASDFNQALVGTGGHTFRLPDATTLTDTTTFQFNNNATGTLTIENNAGTTVGTIAPGGAAGIALLANATVGGTWDVHAYIPEGVTWGTNALALGVTVITGGTWQGGTIQPSYGGTGLTTFTGANNALYSTSASALAAGTLPVAAGGTGLTSFTANGIPYASATNTLTTGSALTFDGTVLGSAGASSGAVLEVLRLSNNGTGDGTQAQVSFRAAFTNYAQITGGFLGAASLISNVNAGGYHALQIGGSEQMRLTSTGLGIGTSSPAQKLVVSNAGAAGFEFDPANTIIQTYNRSSGAYIDMRQYALNIRFFTGSSPTETMRLDSSGNLGIGTTNPQQKLVVSLAGAQGLEISPDAVASAPALVAYNRSGGAYVQLSNLALRHVWQAGASPTEAMRLDSSGNLGIGTSSPSFPLDVNGNARSNAWIGRTNASAPTADCAVFRPADNTLGFSTANTERARITSGGDLLVGTTSTVSGSKLVVASGDANIYGITVGRGAGAVSGNTTFGSLALATNTTGSKNTAIGFGVLNTNTTGLSNTGVGWAALNVTTGSYNTAVGDSALISNTTASNSTAVGYQAMAFMRGDSNTASGYQAMYGSTTPSNNTGTNNVANGYQALNSLTSGAENVAVGAFAGYNYTTANQNVAIGYQSHYSSLGGLRNVSVGYQATYFGGGDDRVSVGYQAGYNYPGYTLSTVVAIGSDTHKYFFSGGSNVAVGYRALYSSSTSYFQQGSGNTVLGAFAAGSGFVARSGSSNTFLGYQSGFSYFSGGTNTGVGTNSLYSVSSGSGNTGIGHQALFNNTSASNNTAIGNNAAFSNTTGAGTTALGNSAAYNITTANNTTAVGDRAVFRMTGAANTGVGVFALIGSGTPASNTGEQNTAIGVQSIGGQNTTTASFNLAAGNDALFLLTTGGSNSSGGWRSGYETTSGSGNVFFGRGAGYETSANVRTNAITTGSNNIYVGAYAYPSGATVTREIVIGYDSTGKGANTGFINPNGGGVFQGNNATTWSTTSDVRIKENFVAVTNGLEVINALDPFEFDYILTGKHDVGFKAQQYMTVLPEQVQKHAASEAEKELVGDNEIYGIQRNLDPYLVSAIKSLTEQVKALQQEIAQLKRV